MARFIDPFYTNTFLDSNLFNEIAEGTNPAVVEILRLYKEGGGIQLLFPYSVQDELKAPNTPEVVRKAATQFVFTEKVTLTDPERKTYEKLLADASGDAEPANIARDLFHVFESAKYGGGHFVTRDKRLLKRIDAISELLQLELATPETFLEKVEMARQRKRQFEQRDK